jgi:hypothetical protein
VRPIDGYSGDTESQDDENDDWRIFHDQASQLWRDAWQAKFVLERRTEQQARVTCCTKILGARRRASAEVTFHLVTVASRDRIAMSQAPITATKRNMQ